MHSGLGLLFLGAALVSGQTEYEACLKMLEAKPPKTSAFVFESQLETNATATCSAFWEAEVVPKEGVIQYVNLTVDPFKSLRTSPKVPGDFLGFAFEWRGVGELAKGPLPNVAVVQLFKNLAVKNLTPNLLIGGNSAMLIQLVGSKIKPLRESIVKVSSSLLKKLNLIAKTTRCKLTLSVPMLSRNTK